MLNQMLNKYHKANNPPIYKVLPAVLATSYLSFSLLNVSLVLYAVFKTLSLAF